MPSESRTNELRLLLEMLKNAAPRRLDQRLELLQQVRRESADQGAEFDHLIVEEMRTLRAGLKTAQSNQAELKAMLDKMTEPPLHPASFLAASNTEPWGPMAVISHRGSRVIMPVADELDLESLSVGDEVLLSTERNVVVGKSPFELAQFGETGIFERFFGDRAIIRSRDEELVVNVANPLRYCGLKRGDRVVWDRSALIAFEKIDHPEGDQYFLEEAPDESFENIGGLDEQIRKLKRMFMLHMHEPGLLSKYGIGPKRSVLLVGPPGTGKTKLARALAAWLGKVAGGRPRFIHIKPGELHSMWFAESERRYREVFRAARESAERHPELPVVIFMDEIDSVASTRGGSLTGVEDRVLAALMSELDGLEKRGNVIVIAATNRVQALDRAVARAGRMLDMVLEVPRPNRQSAEAIFGTYFGHGVPFEVDGLDQASARDDIVELALARLYAPNGDNQVARLTFRDGKERIVTGRDFVSGAMIERIVGDAVEAACHREHEGRSGGVRREDVLAAIDEHVQSAARMLSPQNAANHLDDLPQDVDVVRVEPIRTTVARAHRFLTLDSEEAA